MRIYSFFRRTGFAVCLVCSVLGCSAASFSQDAGLPWLGKSDAERLGTVTSVLTEADVTVSDGTKYRTESLFIDPQRAAFKIIYPDRAVARGVEGKYYWAFEEGAETEGDEALRVFVLGHQIHAQILYFSQIHSGKLKHGKADFIGEPMDFVEAKEGDLTWTMYYRKSAPKGMKLLLPGGQAVQVEFGEFRPARGISLPTEVWFDDGSRRFKYVYSRIAFNEGSIADYRAPESVLTDEQRLLRLHRIVMDDHYFGDASGMKTMNAEPFMVVTEGEVLTMSDAESDAGLDRIMATRDYTVYDDTIRPIVKISQDGTLAWVTVRVYAKGVRFDGEGKPAGPLEFTSAWTELYEKVDGRWQMIGNISNFAPGRK